MSVYIGLLTHEEYFTERTKIVLNHCPTGRYLGLSKCSTITNNISVIIHDYASLCTDKQVFLWVDTRRWN